MPTVQDELAEADETVPLKVGGIVATGTIIDDDSVKPTVTEVRPGRLGLGDDAVPEGTELSYAVMAHITDYDVWHESEEPVTVEMVVRTLLRNAEVAKQAVVNAIGLLQGVGPSPYAEALADALITNRAAVPPQVVQRLDLLLGKYFL